MSDGYKVYASQDYVDGAIEGIEIPDVSKFITEIPSEYITETELNDRGLATENYVKNAIAEAELSGKDDPIDLSGYATKDDIKNFITEIPEEYVTESELNNKGYLTERQSLEGLATEDYVDTKAKEYSDSIVGNLSDYWNSGLQVQDVMSAINANANWVNYNFEKISDRVQNLFNYSTDETKHPSAKATYDLMKFVYDLVMPVKIYDDPKGFEASNDDAGDTWHLTGLDLSPYKRIKCYVCSGGDGDSNYSPQHIVEIHLDDRAKGSFGYFTADHAGHCPNNRNRHHIATFTVNAEKTAIQFQHSISMYGTSASDSVGGRRCYLIEGYYI